MKRFMLFFMFLSLATPAQAEQSQSKSKQILKKKLEKPKEKKKKEEKDSAPLIVGYLLQSIIPHLINAVAAEKEAGDTEAAMQEFSSAIQGIGTLTLELSKALTRQPDLTAEMCLLAYLRSNKGKLFLSKYRSLL